MKNLVSNVVKRNKVVPDDPPHSTAQGLTEGVVLDAAPDDDLNEMADVVNLDAHKNETFGALILAVFCLLAMLSYFFSTLAAFAVLLIKDVWAKREFTFYRNLVMLSSSAMEKKIQKEDAIAEILSRPDPNTTLEQPLHALSPSRPGTSVNRKERGMSPLVPSVASNGQDYIEDFNKRNYFRSVILLTFDVVPGIIALLSGLIEGGMKQSAKNYFFCATVFGLFHVCMSWILYLVLDYKVKVSVIRRVWRHDFQKVLDTVGAMKLDVMMRYLRGRNRILVIRAFMSSRRTLSPSRSRASGNVGALFGPESISKLKAMAQETRQGGELRAESVTEEPISAKLHSEDSQNSPIPTTENNIMIVTGDQKADSITASQILHELGSDADGESKDADGGLSVVPPVDETKIDIPTSSYSPAPHRSQTPSDNGVPPQDTTPLVSPSNNAGAPKPPDADVTANNRLGAFLSRMGGWGKHETAHDHEATDVEKLNHDLPIDQFNQNSQQQTRGGGGASIIQSKLIVHDSDDDDDDDLPEAHGPPPKLCTPRWWKQCGGGRMKPKKKAPQDETAQILKNFKKKWTKEHILRSLTSSQGQIFFVCMSFVFAVIAVIVRAFDLMNVFFFFICMFMLSFLGVFYFAKGKQHFVLHSAKNAKIELKSSSKFVVNGISMLDTITVFLDLYNGMTRSAILRFTSFVACFSTMYLFLFAALGQYIAIAIFGSMYIICCALFISVQYRSALPTWITLLTSSVAFSFVSLVSIFIVLGWPAGVMAIFFLIVSQFYFMRLPKTFASVFSAVFVTFFLVSGLVYSIGSIQDFSPARMAQARNGTLAAPVSLSYSVCSAKWESLGILDYGFMSSLAYTAVDQNAFDSDFNSWFGHTDFEVKYKETSTVSFVDFYSPSRNLSVVAVRGTAVPLDVIQDMDIWLDSLLIQTVSALGPFAGVWPDGLISEIIYVTSLMSRISASSETAYYHRVQEYVDAIHDRSVVLTGHSLGGGVSNIVAAKTKHHAVTFSSPGVLRVSKKVGIADTSILPLSSTVLVPEKDIVPRVDEHGGNTHAILCSASTAECHGLSRTLHVLVNSCGDAHLRGIVPPA